jgi:uncharacterized protein (UPF0147 family)
MATKEQNRESLESAITTLNQIASSPATPKTIKKSISEMTSDLASGEYSMAVRAANAMSMLEDVTQDPNMPSFVRTSIWQAVAKLEGIKE